MARFSYTKTYFRRPGKISEEFYRNMKTQLNINPQININPNPETFTQHFSGYFITIGVCFLLIIICGLIMGNSNESPLVPVMGISIFVIVITVVYLLFEGPSYATYIKDKTDYFNKMKYSILNTSNYYEFVSVFYNE